MEENLNPEENTVYVFVCTPDIDGMLTGIYDAWDKSVGNAQEKGCGHDRILLRVADTYNYSFFHRYIDVTPDAGKALKVSRSICRKLSYELYEHCVHALCSQAEDRVDAVYRFLVLAFRVGTRVTERFGDPRVIRIFELRRSVCDEAHLLSGFVRFTQYQNRVLVAQITPKNDVLELLAAHFADRMSGESWILYDKNRQRCAIFRPEHGVVFMDGALQLPEDDAGDEYPDLWRAFFDSVTIPERKNPRCQQTHLPLRYRPNMTEFQ